jgi:hypothetical protein
MTEASLLPEAAAAAGIITQIFARGSLRFPSPRLRGRGRTEGKR